MLGGEREEREERRERKGARLTGEPASGKTQAPVMPILDFAEAKKREYPVPSPSSVALSSLFGFIFNSCLKNQILSFITSDLFVLPRSVAL